METLGLLLSFIGSIVLACSVIKNPGDAHQLINRKKIYLASIKLRLFRWGLFLLIIGFGMQLTTSLIQYL